ncbi:unnamed protein product [Gordionus sp. m RMFG-2023]
MPNEVQEIKPYKCEYCHKSFANSSYLNQHSRIHAGIKPYNCDLCQRKFTQLSHLQQHVRTHTGDKPYKCSQAGCIKSFTQLSSLQSHSRCHNMNKPYKCNSCYKCFEDEKSLRDHIPKHRFSKHSKIHICFFCGKSYTQEIYLTRHIAKHKHNSDKINIIDRMNMDSHVINRIFPESNESKFISNDDKLFTSNTDNNKKFNDHSFYQIYNETVIYKNNNSSANNPVSIKNNSHNNHMRSNPQNREFIRAFYPGEHSRQINSISHSSFHSFIPLYNHLMENNKKYEQNKVEPSFFQYTNESGTQNFSTSKSYTSHEWEQPNLLYKHSTLTDFLNDNENIIKTI